MGTSQNGFMQRPYVIDGQGVDPTDFENLSARTRANLTDLILGSAMRLQMGRVGPSTEVLNRYDGLSISPGAQIFSLDVAGGAPMRGATAVSYRCNPGPIFYVTGEPVVDGVTPKVVAYYLQKDEISGSFAVGDATHSRFDAVYVRLTSVDGPQETRDFKDAAGVITSQPLVTTKRTKLEWLAVQGTPATAPQIPAAPDATWARWAVYYTRKNQNAAYTAKEVYDYRVPANLHRDIVIPGAGIFAIGGNAIINGSNSQVTFTATGAAGLAGAVCHRSVGRLMGFDFVYGAYAGGVQRITSRGLSGNAPPWYLDIYGGAVSGDPTMPFNDIDGYTLQGGVWVGGDAVVHTTTDSGLALLPIWTNGKGSIAADDFVDYGGSYGTQYLACEFLPATTGETIYACHFDVAG